MGNESHSISKQPGKGKRPKSRRRRNTIDQEHFEVRRIVIARGLQFTNKDFEHRISVLQSTIEEWKKKIKNGRQKPGKDPEENSNLENELIVIEMEKQVFEEVLEKSKLHPIPDSEGKLYGKIILTDRKAKDGKIPEEDPEFPYEYTSHKQQVTYRILVVETKREFKEWLQTDKKNVIVIYAGHSRYGRGACFGYPDDPGDRWGDTFKEPETDKISTKDGLFRLGYDVIGIPLNEIVEHRYHAHPLQGEKKFELDNFTCHPGVKNAKIFPLVFDLDPNKINGSRLVLHKEDWGSWQKVRKKKHSYFRVTPTIDVEPKVQFTSLFAKFDQNQQLWGYIGKKDRKLRILLRGGWKDTTASPWEIGDIEDLKCKVFCHFGCSSLRHFHHIIRGNKYMGWKTTGRGRNKCNFACFTTAESDSFTTPVWLFFLLRFHRRSRNRSWGPALIFACRKASKHLKNKWKCKYKIVMSKK